MVQVISVIGAGTMGNGIAHLFAENEFTVNLIDVNQQQLEKAIKSIDKNLERQITKGIINEDQRKKTLNKISTEMDLATGVRSADLVIEAASENTELKLKIFQQLSV